ncbi:hypothetical protein B9Z55_025415 [Caenorhabditis nigoni]|nr:hypothetical protein B9Z55_025415 [Caenorhabditis nigoni]
MDVMWPNPNDLTSFIPSLEEPLNTISPTPLRNDTKMAGDSSENGNIHAVLSFSFVAAWTAGVISYAMLGMNRCIAICYYGTKARALNQVSVAIACSASTWVIGVGAALVGTLSQPMIGIQRTMWSISFLEPKPHTRNHNTSSIWILMEISGYVKDSLSRHP